MIKRTIKRIQFMSDKVRIHTSPVGDTNQAYWSLKLAEEIFDAGLEKGRANGAILWQRLDPAIAERVQKTDFDPYKTNQFITGIATWLWNHIVFDRNGDMIALHDHGEILFRRRGFESETDLFSRVRRRKEHAVHRGTL